MEKGVVAGVAAVGGGKDAESQFRDELKKRGAALQELFWQELERTRNRLKEAGLAEGRRTVALAGGAGDWRRPEAGGQGALARLRRRRMLKVEGAQSQDWGDMAEEEDDVPSAQDLGGLKATIPHCGKDRTAGAAKVEDNAELLFPEQRV